jgi:hypothetical protein
MSEQLSILGAFIKKQATASSHTGSTAPRTSPGPTATRGAVRGSGLSSGAAMFRSRNSNAGAEKEEQFMQSPIFRAYLKQYYPATHMQDFMRSGGKL